MENVTAFVYWTGMAIILILEFLRVRKSSSAERIANTKRLLTNLVPITLLLVTDAENTFGPNTGLIKRAYVIDELYKRVPDEYKKYITIENLDTLINQTHSRATLYWAEHSQIMNR